MTTTQEMSIPAYYCAAAFAHEQHGPATGGVTPMHVIAACSYLQAQGLGGHELAGTLGKAVEALLDDANQIH